MKPKYVTARFHNQSFVAAIVVCFSSSAMGQTNNDWNGSISSDWNTAANWSAGVVPTKTPGNLHAVINTNSPNKATISSAIVSPVDIFVASGAVTATLDHTAGAASTGGGNWMFVGRNGGTGTYNLANTAGSGGTYTASGQGSGSMSVSGNLFIGGSDGTGSVGNINVNTTGFLSSGGDVEIGTNSSVGTLNIDFGTVSGNGWFEIGNGNTGGAACSGTLNLSGGALNKTGGNHLIVGANGATGVANVSGGAIDVNNEIWVANNGGSNGTLNLSAGSIHNDSWVAIGRNGAALGTVNMTGGSWSKTGGGDFLIGTGGSATGVMNQSAGTVTSNNTVRIGDGGGSTGTLSLSGGSFTGGSELWVGQGGTGTLNLSSTGSLTINSWVAIGRSGGTGTVNMTGGTWTKVGSSNFIVGANGPGTMTVSGGIVDVASANGTDRGVTWVGEDNVGVLTLSGTAEFRTDVARVGVTGASTGTLNLDGGTLKVRQLLGGDGADEVDFNGTQIIATAVSPTFISGLGLALIESGGLKVNSNGFAIASNQAFSGVGGLVKSGAGTFSLTGANTYTGLTSVTAGKLSVTSNTTGNGSITVSDGAALVVIAAALDAQLNSTNVILGVAGSTSLEISNSGIVGNPSNAPLNVTNTLAINGTVTLNFTNSLPSVGAFPLVSYINKTGGNFVLGTLPPGVQGTLVHDTINKVYYLDITSVALPRWDGTVNGVWDVNTTENWMDLITALPSNFINGNPVLFDDNASGPGGSAVTLGTTVIPGGVTFNNSTLAYTLSPTAPAGKISGTGGVTKLGTASLSIDTLNDYTGVTTLSGGVTSVSTLSDAGVASPLGAATAAASNLSISGATLNYTGPTVSTNRGFTTAGADGAIGVASGANLTVSGPVTGSGGSSFNKLGDGSLILANSAVTLGGAGQVNEVLAGTLKFSGPGQTVSIPGELWVGSVPAASGNLVLDNTSLTVGSWLALGRGNGNTGIVSSITATNSTIVFSNFTTGFDNGLPNDCDQTISLINTTWTNSGSTALGESANATTNMTISGTSVVNANGRFQMALGTDSVANVTIQDSGSLNKVGGWFSVGNSSNGVGTMTVKDNGTLTSDGDFNVSDVDTSSGTLNIQGNATVIVGTFFWGKNANTVANVNISGGTFNGGISEIAQGTNSTANVIQTGGTLNFGNNDRMWFGQGGLATWNQSAGVVNCDGYLVIGRGTTSVAAWNVSGGTSNQTTASQGIILAEQGTGTLTISGAGVVDSAGGQVDIATNGGTGTLNLNAGGTLRARRIVENNNGSSAVNFNGGTLIANSPVNSDFITGIDTATINAGGITINSNGQNFLISQSFQGSGSLVKSGSGVVAMDGTNTFTGSTTVSAGALGGTGSLSGPLAVSPGATLAPGHSVGTFTAGATTISGTYACEISGATSDKLVTNGILNVSAATLAITELSAATGSPLIIASYTGAAPAPFAAVTGMPAGYSVDYSFGGNQIALIGAATPFSTWAAAKITAISPTADATKGGDPDNDGVTNASEFALNGNPLSGAASGKVVGKVANVGGSPTLVLTLPVRTGAVFSGATEQVSALIDGVIYSIQGSDQLATWNLAISEVTGTDKTAIESTLPAQGSADWTYRTFQSPGTVIGDPADFLRAVITTP